jgi:type III restriction enzyme
VTAYYEFIENEKTITEDDLRALRTLSRELGSDANPYRCIVSVLMLREGWDVRNVTTIVPLRPLTARSRILPEQTLGRGLRRMTPPGEDQPTEMVTVIEHRAFSDLYQDQLAQEGVSIEVLDAERIPRATVTIYPDGENKDLTALDILIPQLSPGNRIEPALDALTFEDIKAAFTFAPLPLGSAVPREIQYEGRHLITNEIVEQMKVKLPLRGAQGGSYRGIDGFGLREPARSSVVKHSCRGTFLNARTSRRGVAPLDASLQPRPAQLSSKRVASRQ